MAKKRKDHRIDEQDTAGSVRKSTYSGGPKRTRQMNPRAAKQMVKAGPISASKASRLSPREFDDLMSGKHTKTKTARKRVTK